MLKFGLWFESGRTSGSRQAWGPASKFSVGCLILVFVAKFLGVMVPSILLRGFGTSVYIASRSLFGLAACYLAGYGVGLLSKTLFEGREAEAKPRFSAYFCLLPLLCLPTSFATMGWFQMLVLGMFFSTPIALVLYPAAGIYGLYIHLEYLLSGNSHAILMVLTTALGLGLGYLAVERALSGRPLVGRLNLPEKDSESQGTLDVS